MATAIVRLPAVPRLPFDIQLAVAENCPDVPTLLALVSSHRTLRRHGARLALQLPKAQVGLHTETAVVSFFKFTESAYGPLGQLSSPPTHLHTLDISLATVSAANIGKLTTLLAHVPKLTSLTIREPEEVLADGPLLYAALQSLTTLKSLQAFGAGPATRKLLADVKSALEDVTVTPHPIPQVAFDHGPFEVETFLGRHRDTLTRFSASWVLPFADASGDEDEELVVFENVRDLVVPAFVYNRAPDFIDVFPNIVSLDVGTTVTMSWPWGPMSMLNGFRDANKYITGGSDDGESDDESEGEREGSEYDSSDGEEEEDYERDNIGESDENGERGEGGERDEMGERHDANEGHEEEDDDEEPLAWESLEHVRGGLLDLYVFGNSCAVDVLDLDGLIKTGWECVPAVVGDHCPRTLRLSVSSSLEVDTWERNLKKLASVRHLALNIVAEDLFDEEQLMDTAVRAARSFAFCRVVCLDLVGQSDSARSRLGHLNHETLAHGILNKSKATARVCVHTPSRATFWCSGGPILDGEGYAGVRLLLFEEGNPSAECLL